MWYKFVATATSHAITVTPTMATFDPVIDVRSGACLGLNIACADNDGPGTSEFVNATGLVVNATYYVRIYSLGANAVSMGTFEVCVANSPTCFAPTSLAVSNVTSSTATVSFAAPAGGAAGYTLTYTPAGGSPRTQTVTGSPVTLTGLTPGKVYAISLTSTCGGSQTSTAATTSFTTVAALATRSSLAGGELAVFPNPAHASFTVSLPALGAARTAQLELVNTLGQRVRQQTLVLTAGGTQAAVDASSLPVGIYLLRVQASGETAVTRLIIN